MLASVKKVNPSLRDPFFENSEMTGMVLRHHVFNELEAAVYCRCNVECIRYHALRSKKLIFCDFTKEGRVYLKQDLDMFLKSSRKKNYQDI